MTTNQYWQSRIADPSFMANRVTVNGQSFCRGKNPTSYDQWRKDRAWLGMGGDGWMIDYLDGRRDVCLNLWGQGRIPEEFRPQLPDNAARLIPMHHQEIQQWFKTKERAA
jgi:hypothetical protein